MMRQFSVFGFLLRKEFLQIRRNRMIMAVMLIMPVIQLIILANAADYEIRNIKLHVVDEAQSEMSGRMRARFEASPYFTLKSTSIALEPAMELIRANDVDIIVRLPHDLEARRFNSEPFSVQLLVNAINSAKAGLSVNYASAILQGFQGEVIVREVGLNRQAMRFGCASDLGLSLQPGPELSDVHGARYHRDPGYDGRDVFECIEHCAREGNRND